MRELTQIMLVVSSIAGVISLASLVLSLGVLPRLRRELELARKCLDYRERAIEDLSRIGVVDFGHEKACAGFYASLAVDGKLLVRFGACPTALNALLCVHEYFDAPNRDNANGFPVKTNWQPGSTVERAFDGKA